ncbi:MAG: TraB/GumN family protein [Xanthomonadales bacterium]|nr:TraB/GumN family protein [Gammaproteobacteria bacterium]NNE04419.1 TraB/GumN family protein [Xanthomonadales bacterium]NNL94129.1 TraB/GumN family protein [Xanthomonadales bacterium]
MSEAALQAVSDQPLKSVERDGVRYTLLGTAHVSRSSAETVSRLIESGDYDLVAVELCEPRLKALSGERDWQELDVYSLIREKKAGLVMANLALSGYQKRIADQFGIEPGAELKAAADAARQRDLPLQLVDRELSITLKRCFRAVPWYKRMYLATGLLLSSMSSDDIDEEAIEKLKEGDILEATFTEFASHSPELYGALIAERDHYMAARLRALNGDNQGKHVLVVVGAGHLAGLAEALEHDDQNTAEQIAALEALPPRARWPKFIPWIIAALVISGFAIGFSRSPELGWSLVLTWVVINGGLAGLGALAARGHPLTIISAVLAAPLTSLNPAVAAGMVTGLVESWIRKPRGSDLERLREDITTLRGWYRNPATRILLVFFLSNLGSALGTWIAGFRIFGALS